MTATQRKIETIFPPKSFLEGVSKDLRNSWIERSYQKLAGIYAQAADLLGDLFYPSGVDAAGRGRHRKGQITKSEANSLAREYLKEHPTATARQLAKAIGCGLGQVSKLPAWRVVKEELKKGRTPKTHKAVGLTEKVLATISDPNAESPLDRLIREQEADKKADEGYKSRPRKKL